MASDTSEEQLVAKCLVLSGCHLVTITAEAGTARQALWIPDPDVHDPWEDIRDVTEGTPKAPDTSLSWLNEV